MKTKTDLLENNYQLPVIKYFFSFILLLTLIAIINTFQEYFVFHKTKHLFSLFMSNLIYNWYLIILALVGYLLLKLKTKSRLTKTLFITLVSTLLIIMHQVLQHQVDLFFINKADYSKLYDMLIVNPQVWMDYGFCILFAAVYYSIQTRNKTIEKNLYLYKMQEELARIELTDTQSKIQPELIDRALNKMKSFIANSQYEEAEDLLTELSDYIRLILYNDEDYIDIRSQIALLEKYISLRKILYEENLKLESAGLNDVFDKKLSSYSLFYAVKNLLQNELKQAENESSVTTILNLEDDGQIEVILNNRTIKINYINRNN
ncbi:histidine kinase [Melioribacter sp. OK-6-Me]|uniref:histidine kinase n=1 Tax=unclassified Melioribacter TaxID=2627329 RepID=UPI003EDB0B88